MPKTDKNKTPWLLVISSMILLFLFVGYWNVSTYLREKKKLAEDVEIQLQLAFTEVKDSELVYFLRTKLSDDEDGIDFPDSLSMYFESDSAFPSIMGSIQNTVLQEFNNGITEHDTTIILDIKYDTNQISNKNHNFNGKDVTVIATSNSSSVVIDEIEKEDSSTINSDIRFKQFTFNEDPLISKRELRLSTDSNEVTTKANPNGTRFFKKDSLIDHTHGTIFQQLRFSDQFSGDTKSGFNKTYTLLKEKLIENKLPYSFAVVNDPATEPVGMRINFKSNGFVFKNWTVDLQKYQVFLLQKMIPTILFSLILLGIIGLAFWTLLTNWIKQNRLVVVKNEFINNMTHELKTPIATVGVALEAISNFDLSKDQDKTKEYVDISRNEINRLSLLVDKVLNIAAFDSKGSALKSDNVDLETTIAAIIQSMKLQFETKNAKVNFTKNGSNFMLKGDKLHLGNVVHNILDNALKYSSTHPEIEINLTEQKDNLILNFKDNGQGIPKAYQSKIFDRFFRVPSADLHDVKGHGLGLNYVQNIVHALDGKIVVNSVENQGSTFTITLPKTNAHV